MKVAGISSTDMTVPTLDMSATNGAAGAAQTQATDETFGQALDHIVNSAVGTMRSGEAAAIQGLQGSMPPFQVVESMMNAQRTLQAALAIRDKAISAYQEITRMPI
jgi:flagellar hook-basal body complex protein FliE